MAIVSVPVRVDAVSFESTVNVVEPLPAPELPDMMWIQETLLAAVHAHAVWEVVMSTVNDPPMGYPLMVAPTDIAYVHGGASVAATANVRGVVEPHVSETARGPGDQLIMPSGVIGPP